MVNDYSDSERGKETRCRHMGYSFRLAVRVLLYASSHRQDSTLLYNTLLCLKIHRHIIMMDRVIKVANCYFNSSLYLLKVQASLPTGRSGVASKLPDVLIC